MIFRNIMTQADITVSDTWATRTYAVQNIVPYSGELSRFSMAGMEGVPYF